MDKAPRLLMLILLFIGYTFVYIDKTVMGFALLPIREEFSLTPQQVGYITAAFFCSYALFQLPAGWLIDRVGYKKMLLLSLTMLALCALLFGAFGKSLLLLAAFRFLDGVAHSGYPGATAKAISVNFTLHQRTFAQSLLLSSSGIAMAVGPILAVWALSAMSWHHAFMLLAAMVLIVAVMMSRLPAGPRVSAESAPAIRWRALLRIPLIWQLLLASLCINIPVYGLMAWLPTFLVQQRGFSLAAAGELTGLAGVGTWLATVASGWLVGRFMPGREPWVILLASLTAAIGLLALFLVRQPWACAIALFVTDAALVCAFITTFTLPMKRFSPAIVGSTVGLVNAGGVVGGVVGPVVMGYLLAAFHGHYLFCFLFLITTTLIAGVALLPGVRSRPSLLLLQE